MRKNRLNILLAFSILLLLMTTKNGWSESLHPARAKIGELKVWRVEGNTQHPIHIGLMTENEVERVLLSVEQISGISSLNLPATYYLLRFTTPVVLPASPIGHPIREAVIILPANVWDRHKLLIKNAQNQWVEYRASRPLGILVNQLKAREIKASSI